VDFWISTKISDGTSCYGPGTGSATVTLSSDSGGIKTFTGVGPFSNADPNPSSGYTTFTLVWNTNTNNISLNIPAFMFSPVIVVRGTPVGVFNQDQTGASTDCGGLVRDVGSYTVS